jgi:hypothetical protein
MIESSAKVQPVGRRSFKYRLIEKMKELRNLKVLTPFFGIGVLWYHNRFYRKGKSHIQMLCENQFDIIFSTYSTYSSHKLAARLKSVSPKSFWIADYRDPVYSPGISIIMKPWAKTFARRVTGKADIITAVSKGYLDNLFFDEHPNKAVITNGYDLDDISEIEYKVNEKFTIIYIGMLYFGRRDLSPLFEVVKELVEENELRQSEISIKYAGPSKQDFLTQALKSELTDCIDASENLPRTQALKMQLESHMLILATWNNTSEQGVVPGKFIEYMMMNKPIIALVAGTKGDSTVRHMLEEGNLGICYEEAFKDQDKHALKDYVLKQYQLFKQGIPLDFNPNQKFVEKFNYKEITKSFTALFPEELKSNTEKSQPRGIV